MATRTIVTSQPDLPCDVCGRRLLRGERPDVFLAGGGRRLTVCELCAPRAAHEGWRRESAHAEALELAPARPRRARNLLGRLRQLREPGRAFATRELASSAETSPPTPVSAPAQGMAEEFEPVEPVESLRGGAPVAGASAAKIESREDAVAPVAAPAPAPAPEDLAETTAGVEPDLAVENTWSSAPGTPAAKTHLAAENPWRSASPETQTTLVDDDPESLLGESEPLLGESAADTARDERRGSAAEELYEPPAEEGSWRDAWMFVGE